MRTSRLKDLFPRASQRVFPAFLNMGGHPADRGKAGLLQNGIRGAPWFDRGIHCVERLALIAIEPESDLTAVGFRAAWHSEKPE